MTPEQERAEARKLADKVKYRISMIEGGYAEGGIPITTPELKVLLEDYRNSLDREEQLIKQMEFLKEALSAVVSESRKDKLKSDEWTETVVAEARQLLSKVAEQDKEIQRYKDLFDAIRERANGETGTRFAAYIHSVLLNEGTNQS